MLWNCLNGGAERGNSLRIDDCSSKSFRTIFEKHISNKAKVKTDNRKEYKALMKDYDIAQSKSDNGGSMPKFHIAVHLMKSWIRTVHFWVHPERIDWYLDAFFSHNRLVHKKQYSTK